MIISASRLVSEAPRELRINKKDLMEILAQIVVEQKNVRLKGLGGDVVFLNSNNNYPAGCEEKVTEVEEWT